jgi:hypothetical protein
LKHTLQTVLEQRYDNLQIVIQDNASRDETRDVVEAAKDSRIVYRRNTTRTGMASNWEHALDAVDGDFVFYLGDDDGLLQGACERASQLLSAHSVPAVAWHKADYLWPDSPIHPNLLRVPRNSGCFMMPSRSLLWMVSRGLTSYGRLPNLYTAFVSMRLIGGIRNRLGRFFFSPTPDVYSGIVCAAHMDSFLYLSQPLSINGGSGKSNGLSINKASHVRPHQQFWQENDLPIHGVIPIITGSIASCVGEAFLQAQERGLTGQLTLNERRYWQMIGNDLMRMSPHSLAFALSDLGPHRSKLQRRHRRALDLAASHESASTPSIVDDRKRLQTRDSDDWDQIDLHTLPIRDVYQACTLVSAMCRHVDCDQPQRLTTPRFILNRLLGVRLASLQRRHFPQL